MEETNFSVDRHVVQMERRQIFRRYFILTQLCYVGSCLSIAFCFIFALVPFSGLTVQISLALSAICLVLGFLLIGCGLASKNAATQHIPRNIETCLCFYCTVSSTSAEPSTINGHRSTLPPNYNELDFSTPEDPPPAYEDIAIDLPEIGSGIYQAAGLYNMDDISKEDVTLHL